MAELSVFGVKVHYDKLGEEGPPLVFVHGWCANRLSFTEQMKFFSSRYQCYAIDLPGHGRSAKTFIDHSIVFMAEILAGFLAKMGLMDVTLVGHSMGGAVVLEAVHQKANGIASLILLDPSMIVRSEPVTAAITENMNQMHEHGPGTYTDTLIKRVMVNAHDKPSLADWILKTASKIPPHVALSAWQGLLEWNGKQALEAASDLPCAVIVSDKPSNKRADLMKIHKRLDWGQTLGGSHYAHMSMPHQVNMMMDTYLRRLD